MERLRKKMTKEQKKKIGDANRGKKRTPETIEKMKEAKKNVVVTNETKQKLSDSLKKYWSTVIWVDETDNETINTIK